jgi:Uncharacterized conserved protein (DUF2190)
MPVPVAYNSQDISAFPQTVNDSSGVLANRVVVAGTGAEQVKRPAAANASKIIGVAGHDAADTENVSVYNSGLVYCVSSAAISVGDYVNIASTAGDVKTVSETAGTINTFGIARSAATAGSQYVKVQIQIQLR